MTTTAPSKDLNMVMLSARKCGFCNTGTHDRCPGGTRSGRVGVRICPCEVGERCGKPRCLRCNNRNVEGLDLTTWTCASVTECESRVQARLADSPMHQQILKIKEKTMAEAATATKDKREKVVKEGKCLVTGKPTKGGLFAPGQDAKYVSLRVAEVAAANFTKKAEDAGLRQMKADGVSEKLQAKYTKAVGLAKERAEKAKAQADEKAAAKKATPAKSKASKAAEADDEE